MFEKNNKKISPKKEYLSTSDLVVYLGLTLPEKREKLQEIISKLYEDKVSYLNENGELLPLVICQYTKGRFPSHFAVKNTSFTLKLIARIVQEKGLDVYFFREGVSPLELREKLSHLVGLDRIRRKLKELYRLNLQFEDENHVLQDVVLQNKKDTMFFLHPSEKAFEIFSEKIEKMLHKPVITPAQVAVKLGLHKGFGTLIETQLGKMYRQNYIFFDEQGAEHPLIKKYIIGKKERFFLSSCPNAFETFKEIYSEGKESFSLTPGLKKLKEENPDAFYDELNEAYREKVLYENESGKLRPLIEQRVSITKGCRLIISQNSNAYQLFSARLKQRIKEYELLKKSLTLTEILRKLSFSNYYAYSVKAVLKMLYESDICYVDAFKHVRPLVIKKRDKYFLMDGDRALKVFSAHFKAFVKSYAEKPKNYLSFEKAVALLGEDMTRLQFFKMLDEIQQSGIVTLNEKGQASLAVQRYRVKDKVLPFLHGSVEALQVVKRRLVHQRQKSNS